MRKDYGSVTSLVNDLSHDPDSIFDITKRTSESPSTAELFKWLNGINCAVNADYESRKLLIISIRGNPLDALDAMKAWTRPIEISTMLQGGYYSILNQSYYFPTTYVTHIQDRA